MKPQDKAFMVIGSTVLIAAAGVTGLYLFGKSDKTATMPQTTANTTQSVATTPTTSTANSSATASNTSYKDGTYTATANYNVPHGYSNVITTSITIKNGVVTSASATHDSSDRESEMYISDFDSALTSAVVGKPVGSLSPSRIGGASLTTYGFDKALSEIVTKAS